VTIDGPVTVTIEGPGGPYVVTETDTLDLPAGDYTWTAEAPDTHQLDADSGAFTVQSCPRIPASVDVEVGPCPAPGSATVPVTVTIDGPVTVTIEGPGGPYVVTETDTLDLPAGDYTWTAEAPDTHQLDADSGEFTVQSCPAIEASVLVTVGACPSNSSATRPVDVAISPDGGAEVTVSGPDGFNAVATGAGDTLDLEPGEYSWSATANETFELIGATEGTFKVAGCIVEVLPKTILPKTGTSGVTGYALVGAMFVLLGCAMVAVSHRPATADAGWNRFAVLERLGGRTTPASPRLLMLAMISTVRSKFPTGGFRRNHDRGGPGRAGP
jgi:LPXTG-motif cell wall-anchored protein